MNQSWIELFQYPYAIRAMAASAMVGITCGVLGCFVILRRMALIGDALSHAVLPGVVLGFVFFGYNSLAIFAGAVLAGLLTSVIITWIQRNSITKDDASIGIVFTAMFAVGIMGISWLTKQQGVHIDMKDFLFGNVLGVNNTDLWLTGAIGVYVLLCIGLFYKYFFITSFDPLIALTMGISVAVVHYFFMFMLSLTIVASIQSVGVILVVAMLIIPSSTAYLLTHQLLYMLVISAGVGLCSAVLGFMGAIYFETTPGPAMTLLATMFFMLALLFSPKRGFLITRWIKFRKRWVAEREDVLKKISKLMLLHPSISSDLLLAELNIGKLRMQAHLSYLRKKQFIIFYNNSDFALTDAGKSESEVLVRAHRMWESYLVNKMNVPKDQIHESAEAMEHILPIELVDKIEKDLGYPEKDPHGAPIPKIKKHVIKLSDVPLGKVGTIAQEQTTGVKELWKKGIFPLIDFKVEERIENEHVKININDKFHVFTWAEAEKIKVLH